MTFKSQFSRGFTSKIKTDHIPYKELQSSDILIEGEPGPNGLIVIKKTLENGVKFKGEFNKETQTFEGLGKFEDPINHIESLANYKNSKKYGKGIFKFSNGDLYIGEFKNDEMNGNGIYYYSETGAILQGDVFRGGEIMGKGRYIWQKGAKGKGDFEGEIKDGVPHGAGFCTWDDTSWYDGDWVKGVREGNGNYEFLNENIFYNGEWVNDKFDGLGTLKEGNLTFRGHFNEGKRVKYFF